MRAVQDLGELQPQFQDIFNRAVDKTDFVDVTAPGTANTEFSVEHGLGIEPTGFLVSQKDRAADVYLSGTANTAALLYLKCTVASAVLRIVVF